MGKKWKVDKTKVKALYQYEYFEWSMQLVIMTPYLTFTVQNHVQQIMCSANQQIYFDVKQIKINIFMIIHFKRHRIMPSDLTRIR